MATVGSFVAVVLAAGSGSRFGGGKLLADYQGAPLLHAALAAASAAPVDWVTLVTGADAELVGTCARAFDPQVRVVHAADHAEGMAASLRTGIASLDPGVAGAFIFLGDMPRVPRAVLAPLREALQAGAPAAAPVFGGRRGNPVVLGQALFGEVASLRGDVGARSILQGLGAKLALVEAPDDGVLFDVDWPSDLSKVRP